MKKIILILLTAATIGLTSVAAAHQTKHSRPHDHDTSFTDYAIVTHVSPVYKRRAQCRDHDDSHSSYDYDYNNDSNYRQHKKERKNLKKNSSGKIKGKAQSRHLSISIDFDNFPLPRPHHQQQRRCKIGYDVTYRYHGRSYTTFMKQRPEHRIRLQVNIKPINAW